MSIYLPKSAANWGGEQFKSILQKEVAQLGLEVLPLQQGLNVASYALSEDISTMLLSAEEQDGVVIARLGVFFKGMIPGCACADDPTPEEIYNEYCELKITLTLDSSEAALEVLE